MGGPQIAIVCEPKLGYSLSMVARRLARLLEARHPGCVRFIPRDHWIDDLSLVSAFERDFTAAVLQRPGFTDGPTVLVWLCQPPGIPDRPGDRNIAFFYWEDYPVPETIVTVLNAHYDAVVTNCRFIERVAVNSGVRIPVHVTGWAPDLDDLRPVRDRRLTGAAADGIFTFLHVSTCSPRKGVDSLLRAYVKAFRRHDPVRLLVKNNPTYDWLQLCLDALPDDPDRPLIEVVTAHLDRRDIVDLYARADAVVLPTRGEGYNLPAAEAMAAGVPLIVTGYSAHLDFCDARTARLVDYRFEAGMHEVNASPHAVWVTADDDDLAAAMREAVAMPRAAVAARVAAAARRIDTETAPDRFVDRFLAVCLDGAPRCHGRLRLAWISSWGRDCPVAAFSARLLPHLADGFAVTVICPGGGQPGVTEVCPWTAPDLAKSVERAAGGADIRVLQHHPDLLAWRDLPAVLEQLSARPLVIVLHRTRDLDGTRQDVAAALARITRIVVHTISDLNRLKALGLVESVTMLPHGAPASWPVRRPARVPRPFRPRARFLIGCYAACRPGGGLAELVAAVAILRRAGIDVRLRVVTYHQRGEEAATVLQAGRSLARTNAIEDAVTWHAGALADEAATALLAECDIVVLPDQYDRASASGAARLALCAGAPVIVSPLAQFDDLGPAVARLPGVDESAIADGVFGFLRDLDARIAVQHMAGAWLAVYAWNRIAGRYGGMLTTLGARTGA